MNSWIVRASVAAIVLSTLRLASAALLPGGSAAPGWLPWALLANTLVALVTSGLAARVRGSAWRRALVVFGVLYGIQANNLIEALVFVGQVPVARLLLSELLVAVLYAWFLSRWVRGPMGSGSHEPPPAGRDRRSLLAVFGRVLVCDAVYVLLYVAAGLAVSPWIAGYYASRPMPAPGLVIGFELSVRGPVLVAVVLLVVRAMRGRRLPSALWSGLTLAVIAGVAPLIVPNPYLPDAVRYFHLAEVGGSSLLFGSSCGWLLWPIARTSRLSPDRLALRAHA